MEANEFKERRYLDKYDENNCIVYLNEQPAVITETTEEAEGQTEATTCEGFSYSGDMPDGGTLIPVRFEDITEENLRAKLIAGLVRKRYSADDVEGITLNGEDTPEHAEELAELQKYRRQVKDTVDAYLNR